VPRREEGEPNHSPRDQIYENVDLFKRYSDPFGADFENALKQGVKIRVQKISTSSSYSEETSTPSFPATPTKNYESPAIPVKKCSRSVSQVSRNSVESTECDRIHVPKYSYDQVSISSNFNKPVVHTPPTEKVYDVFSNISFSSPLQCLDDGDSESSQKMNSLGSTISSLKIRDDPDPEEDWDGEDPYENIDEIRQTVLSSAQKRLSLGKVAPEPPPRNSILKPANIRAKPDNNIRDKPDAKKEDPYPDIRTKVGGQSEENLYSSAEFRENNFRTEESLFDRLMNESSLHPANLEPTGARPKSTKTIDIRSRVHAWYEEAAREVERDLSLDIQELEKSGKKSPKKKATYEHVMLATTGRVVNDDIVPKPTVTLLRDFDPCYEVEETESEATASNDALDVQDIEDLPDDLPEDETDDNFEADTEAIIKEEEEDPPKPSPRDEKSKKFPGSKKFPALVTPKRINFGGGGHNVTPGSGPPKPPRSYDYYATAEEEANKKERRKSPRELFNKFRKSSAETSSIVGTTDAGTHTEDGVSRLNISGEVDTQSEKSDLNTSSELPNNSDRSADFSPSRSDRDNKSEPSDLKAGLDCAAATRVDRVPENLYVTLPSSGRGSTSPPGKDDLSSPPPPLPTTLPPSALSSAATEAVAGTKPRQTMYENVWIERSSPDADAAAEGRLEPPMVPPRGSKPRKHSKPELNNSKGSLHCKSDSMDSGSSIATTDSNQSKEHQLDGGKGPEKKTKLKKIPSVRSFSVANIKLGKLPGSGLADNIKRRMSDNIKPNIHQLPGARASLFGGSGTPEDTDDDEISVNMLDIPATRSAFLFNQSINESKTRNHSAAIFVLSRRKKQFLVKWCVLGEGLLKWFNEESVARPKETIMLSNIFTITKRVEKHLDPDQRELYCFDIAAINSKGKYGVYMVGCLTAGEREVWMERIVQSMGTRLNTFSMVGCRRIGWAYLKAGFAAEWSLSWIYLADRYIVYATQDSIDFEKIDLKKTKDVFVRKDSKNLCLPPGFTKHPVLVCDFNDRSLYMLVGVVSEVEVWRSHIEDIAFTNNNILGDQQVTHENVPVIVDKCVKFVFSHGVMTEGIYRLAGVNTKINKLLAEFRNNAWAVQISRENYSEHDVANVLKRFVRQLQEPLLTDYLKESFLKATSSTDLDAKLKRYKDLLKQLPGINYSTIRKLLGHLHTVAEQYEKNLMPVINLAPLWGPNMLIVDGQEQDFGETSRETIVCGDLITNYPYLFDVDMDELDKEKKLVEVLDKINNPTPSTLKRSGDIRMWCYIETRTGGKCVSISLHPSLTAGEAVHLVAKEADIQDLQGLLIHEVVLGECLERPVHYTEKMLDLTLRWGIWEDGDRHNNYLLLKRNLLYADAVACAIPPLSIFSEIQFCDNKPKSKFCKFLFSVSNASITCYKEDKNGHTTETNAWPVEDIIWYIGCEKKRNAPHPLNLTFISKEAVPVRSKETPLFGRVLSFGSRELFTKWMAALLVAEYGTNIVQSNLVVLE